jgi:uncharacterized protein YgiB involved in biofilm formation
MQSAIYLLEEGELSSSFLMPVLAGYLLPFVIIILEGSGYRKRI